MTRRGRPVVPPGREPGQRTPAWADRNAGILDRIELGRLPEQICREMGIDIRTYQRHKAALKKEGRI